VWRTWIETGKYDVLRADQQIRIPSEKEQMPSDLIGSKILRTVRDHFSVEKSWLGLHIFEKFASEVFKMMEKSVVGEVMTGIGPDGGRDAFGRFHIGPKPGGIDIEWSLEAKCQEAGCGVKQTQRLISRLRRRQFGIFVTTSFLNKQPYREIREDRHPVIIITGKDISETLVRNGYDSVKAVENSLKNIR